MPLCRYATLPLVPGVVMIWREKRILLIVLGLLLAANTVFFFTYRVRYEERLKDLDDRLTQSEARLATAQSVRTTAECRVMAVRKTQHDVHEVYDKQWATEQERLTALITEVERLAAASQLVPPSRSFARTVNTQTQRRGRVAAEVVGINFTVRGTYQQMRRLINLLELSRQFVIIDQISISTSDNQQLTMTLQLKTLFRDVTQPGAPPKQL